MLAYGAAESDRGNHMRILLALLALLAAGTASAQSPPPTVGGKPLVQVRPRSAAAAKPVRPQSLAVRLQACLEIEDGSKGRLDCYDAVIAPQPSKKPAAKPPKAKSVMDCRIVKEEDERLACFNGFVERLPKLPAS